VLVDSHYHLGRCRVFDLDMTEQDVLEPHDSEGFDVTLVQPYPGAPDPVATHDRIAALAASSGGRVRGFASYNPHRDPAEYFAEVSRCVRDLGFVGIKLHTIGHALNPLSVDGGTVFETARELDVPVMLHTGAGIPFADPAMVIPRAKQFPDVRIILGHAGWSIFTGSAIAVAETFDNIYLETSWCRSSDLAGIVGRVGGRRVMYGSDHPKNVVPELAKYRSAGLSQEDLDLVLGDTAAEVFRL